MDAIVFAHDQRPNSSSSVFMPHTRWWLSNSGVGGIVDSIDQVQESESEVKISEDSKVRRENQVMEEYFASYPKTNAAFHLDEAVKNCYSRCKNSEDSWSKEFEAKINNDLVPDTRMIELDSCNHLLFERPKKLSSELDSQYTEHKKMEPWWQAADKDDLASLGSQGPAHEISTLGFQEVQSLHIEKSSVSDDKSLVKRGLMELIKQESDEKLSTQFSSNENKVGSSDTHGLTGCDLSRTQLIEALCHSQTRARKAEKLAQEACDEKDHVINIFFQQASCLFAYRQWIRLLQLETTCLRLRNKDSHSSFSTPTLCRCVPSRETQCRRVQRKPGKQSCRFCIYNCAVAVAVGLSLAGTGLLVGWTIGWLFPAL